MKNKTKEYSNILKHAEDIIFNRGEEKERQYGPLARSMEETAKIASIMCAKNLVAEDIFKVLIALKAARTKYNLKYDTLLDLIGYTAGLNDYTIKNYKIQNNDKK